MPEQFRLDINSDGMEAAVCGFMRKLLSSGSTSRIFAPQYDEGGIASYATLVDDRQGLARSAILAPYLNGNKGREAGMVSRESGNNLKTIVVLRPCEARAFIELAKLSQADRQRVLLITFDCPGTLSLNEYKRFRKKYAAERQSIDVFYSLLGNGERIAEFQVRDCCTYCESLAHPDSDIKILLVGTGEGEIAVEAGSEAGEKALKALNLNTHAQIENDLRTKFTDARQASRRKCEEDWSKEIVSIESFLSLLTHCRRCYNCRAECPICYCRECVFQTSTFETTPETILRRASQFGVIKMPPDTLLFQLTRMNHMASSCVACGQCTEACPQGIPVGRIFSSVAKRVQDMFGYSAGAKVTDELPLTIYNENELEPR